MQTTVPTGWFHVVFNYIGPDNGEGGTIYHDGVEELRKDYRNNHGYAYAAGSGVVVIGRPYPSSDEKYTSVMVDELMFFNRKLTLEEIENLYNQHK